MSEVKLDYQQFLTDIKHKINNILNVNGTIRYRKI